MLGVGWKFAVAPRAAGFVMYSGASRTFRPAMSYVGILGGRTGARSEAALGSHFACRNGVGESLVVELVLIRVGRREAGDRPVE
jgi:hypothetical protein